MRVLIINTSGRTGGAAVAANRLMEALNNNGEKAKMLVCDKDTDQITVVGLHNGLRRHLNFLWERWCIFVRMHFSKKNLFEVDIANAGMDITKLREFKEADVIHLSWINQGMLSLKGIRKILESGKPDCRNIPPAVLKVKPAQSGKESLFQGALPINHRRVPHPGAKDNQGCKQKQTPKIHADTVQGAAGLPGSKHDYLFI